MISIKTAIVFNQVDQNNAIPFIETGWTNQRL